MIDLAPLDLPNLRRLAAAEAADFQATEGALPPAHVAARALAQLESGVAPDWCVPYLIVARESGEILGGCRFKGEPVDGRVEIGYGVARSARRRGVATAAVVRMIGLAADSGLVRYVDAHILPDNIASSRVVSRLGFSRLGTVVDPDGELVVHWAYRVAV
ncbi:GNAT family N-acetyltransferase [Frateuria soli]|uniref:GNAT family N-acetyltransferase n=1 Tax=Frateuria soli TaxID=1542730 RepID=UPI001E41365F|nr:GNAT family N-acetyltransferase [Frateuria soli]UGB38700.1 GNAT family N-acetyltransferase [Frateuria soli]